MASLLTTFLTPWRRRSAEHCIVCREKVAAEDPRVRLPGGGYVHRGCSTYSMRARPLRPATD